MALIIVDQRLGDGPDDVHKLFVARKELRRRRERRGDVRPGIISGF